MNTSANNATAFHKSPSPNSSLISDSFLGIPPLPHPSTGCKVGGLSAMQRVPELGAESPERQEADDPADKVQP